MPEERGPHHGVPGAVLDEVVAPPVPRHGAWAHGAVPLRGHAMCSH